MLRWIAPIFALMLAGCAAPHTPPPYYPTAQYGTGVPLGVGVWLYPPYSSIVPLEILEDNRCPPNVQCVWAGQVRIKARISKDNYPDSPGISTEPYAILSVDQELTTGEPFFLFRGSITLESVTPEPARQGETISPEDYRFTFSFTPMDAAD